MDSITCWLTLLSNDEIFGWTELKAFADDK